MKRILILLPLLAIVLVGKANAATPPCLETTWFFDGPTLTPSTPPSVIIDVQTFLAPPPNPNNLYYDTWHTEPLPGYTLQSVLVDAPGFAVGAPELTMPDGQTAPGDGVSSMIVVACPEEVAPTTSSPTITSTTSAESVSEVSTSTTPPTVAVAVEAVGVQPSFTG